MDTNYHQTLFKINFVIDDFENFIIIYITRTFVVILFTITIAKIIYFIIGRANYIINFIIDCGSKPIKDFL